MAMEGYWLNAKNGKYKGVHEHANFLQDPNNVKKIGLSSRFVKETKGLDWIKDRPEILIAAMNEGLVRIRGHGNLISFEFTYDTRKVLHAVEDFLDKVFLAGPMSTLRFNNIRTHESIDISYNNFIEQMMDDWRKVLRVAGKSKMNYDEKRIAKIVKRIVK